MGAVEKCELYPHNPQGIVKLKFVSSSAANECIEVRVGDKSVVDEWTLL